MASPRALAAANNAALCHVVARTHGLDARCAADAWTSATRTPDLYPDAVTLVAEPALPDLLARIDSSPGCTIKDSFATLRLAPHGFRILFEAHWIVRAPTTLERPTMGQRWTVVRDPSAFSAWETAWRGHGGAAGVLLEDLLAHESIAVIAADTGGSIVSGALLNRAAGVVGLSNFFTDAAAPSAWEGCVAFAATLFPGLPLAGYVREGALEAARRLGFEAVGPLRVWLREVPACGTVRPSCTGAAAPAAPGA